MAVKKVILVALLMGGCQSVEESFAPSNKAQILCQDYPVDALPDSRGSVTLWARSISTITKWDLIGPPAFLTPLNKDHARVTGKPGAYTVHAYNTDGQCGTGSFEIGG